MAAPVRPSILSLPTGALAPDGMDRARRLAWFDVQRTGENQKLGPSADPTHSHWLHKFDLSNTFNLYYGQIVDEVAYVNCYKVQVENGSTTIWCTALSQTALQPIGTRQLGQIPIGSQVIIAMHPSDTTGIILGVIPAPTTSSANVLTDFISQGSRAGLLVDSAHFSLIANLDASLIQDWSAGRPYDATSTGEQGHITETGLLKFIDSFMALTRVDEECGVWHFYTDALTRIAGHNFQLWTTGYEREDNDDEGEFNSVHGYTPYFWEALGALEFGTNTCRTIPPECWQRDPQLQGYSGSEPCNDYQQPYYRLQDFYGYLGQGYKRVLSVPPQRCSESIVPTFSETSSSGSVHCVLDVCDTTNLNIMGDETVFPGVFEENLALTGRWAVRSAHEVLISKHMLIPAPKRLRLAQDANGDSADSYQAAGVYAAAGLPHKVAGNIDVPDGDDPTQIRAAGFLDTHAFAFNWVGEHPFYYHTLDWYLPEESDLAYMAYNCNTVQLHVPYFHKLSCDHLLAAPPPIPIKVDHRYGKVEYYPNHSYFALLADGGIVMGDGFGAEFKMANGHFWLTAPGDGNIHVGRDVVNLAGRDFVARCRNSWDITATERDGRLKAHNNLWLLASGGAGGIMLQSNADGVYNNGETGERAILSGISLLAKDSMISISSQDTAFHMTEDNDHNVLTFDAGWNGKLRFKCKYFERFMEESGAALDFWVTPDGHGGGNVFRGTECWSDGVLICNPLVVTNDILVDGTGTFADSIFSVTGHVATGLARVMHGQVGLLSPNMLDIDFDYFADRCEFLLPDIGTSELAALHLRQTDYVIDDVDFTFRAVDEYRTTDFVLFESRWQQMARIGGEIVDGIAGWTEEEVNSTYPYPGKEVLLGDTFRVIDPKLYDVDTMVAEDRGGADYETPLFNSPIALQLDGNYLVIS